MNSNALPTLSKGQTTINLTTICDIYPDDAIWVRIQTAWWLAKQEVAIRKFSSLVECILSTHGYKATAYCDDKAAWDIVILLARWLRTGLKTRLQGSPYYGITVDETTDKSTTSQLIIYVKYLMHNTEGNLAVTIEYLDLVSLSGGTALDIMVIFYFINNVNYIDCHSLVS
jgi:hypothetical protein